MKAIFYQNKNLEKVLDILLFIVAFSTPFLFFFNSISIFLLFLFSFFWFDKRKYSLKKMPFFLFVLFFILQIVGIFYCELPEKGVATVIKSVVFLVFPIAFINLSNAITKHSVLVAIKGLIIGILLILISTHFLIIKDVITKGFNVSSLFTNYFREDFINMGLVKVHAPYLGMLVIMSLIFTYLIPFKKNKGLKWVVILYLMISLLQISTIMSLFILGIFFGYLLFKSFKYKKFKVIGLFVIIAIGFIYFSYKNQIDITNKDFFLKRVETIFKTGDETRKENWKSVISVIKDNFFLGIGTDGGLKQLQQHRNKQSEPYINKHNAHNQFLENFLRYGILGIVVYLSILIFLIKEALRNKNNFFIWFLIVFIISSFTESLLQRQIGLVFFTFYSCLFLVFSLNKNNSILQK